MLKTEPLWRTGLIYASLGAFISMAFDCFIWMDPKTPNHYLLFGTIFGLFMTLSSRYLHRRALRRADKTTVS